MSSVAKDELPGMKSLEKVLLYSSFVNLLVVAALGILLRSLPFINGFPLLYKNVLHAHSHFAFGGWLMPVLLLLILKKFPAIKQAMGYFHARNISIILLLSSYGMLASFPFMGYKATSIFFSTLSVIGSFYLVVQIWKALSGRKLETSEKFLKAGSFYLAISAIGPFATGPLIAMGQQGSPLYFNSIYFYLHFQVNGWFVFAILAFIYQQMEKAGRPANGNKVFYLFNTACIPAFFLSVLWNQPHMVFNWIGAVAATIQLVGLYFMLKDLRQWKQAAGNLFQAVMAAFVLKNILQLLSAHPMLAEMAYQNKNFIIAYLHLVLLGFVSLFVFHEVFKKISNTILAGIGMKSFITGFVITELLLVVYAAGSVFAFPVPYYNELLLLFSWLFPVGISLMILALRPSLKTRLQFN